MRNFEHKSQGKSQVLKIAVLGVASLALGITPIVPIANAASTSTAATQITSVSSVVKSINFSAKSYITLADVSMIPSDNGQTVAYTLAITNNEAKSVDLSDYWFRLTNKAGSTYSIKTAGDGKGAAVDFKTTRIAPNSKMYLTLYASVGGNTKLSDLLLKVIKFDFSASGYEKSLGQFTVPLNYTNAVASTSYKALFFNNTSLYTKIASATVGQSGDNNLLNISFIYNNSGKKTATISKFKYYVVTGAGMMYEATPADASDLVIDPLVRKEVKLTATLPAKVSTNGSKLIVVRDSGGDASVQLPMGEYNLKFNTGDTSTNASDTFTYATTNGNFQFNLLEVLREPWENQDILSARIRISNKSANSLTLPTLAGYFYLDNKVQLDFKVISTTNQFGLNPNGYVDVDVYAKMPSNYSFTKVKLIVNNKVDDKTSTKAGELETSSYLSQIPKYAVDKIYNVTRDGSQMDGAISAVNIYNNAVSKLYTVQMTLDSKEKRTIDPVKLVGVFVSDNGDIFPATATTGEGKVNPTNKSLVNFTATLPQNYDSGNLKLIVGEGVADSKYATGTVAAEAYVNGVQFSLPQEKPTQTTYSNLALLPYNLTVNKFTPQIFGQDIQLKLDYVLDKDMTYNVYPADHKLLLTIEGQDKNKGTIYTYMSQELTLEGDAANALQPGADKSITLKKTLDNDGLDLNLNFKTRLYEVVQGSKKLIAERPFYWFIENDWTKDNAATK